MNLKQEHYMLTILQEGSITRAAKKLYISQPSLSQMVKLVETSLGTPIFQRNTDPVKLTPAGEKYINAAKQLISIEQNLQREILEIGQENSGTLRFGIPVQRAMQVMPYILPKFKALYPLVSLELSEHGSATTESLVLEGSVDLACLTTSPRHEELNYILIEEEDCVLLTSRHSEIARRVPSGTAIDITEARNETFISIKPGHSIRTIQDRLFITYDMQPEILLETSSIEVGKRTAIACDAVMLCPINYIEMSPELHPFCCVYPIRGLQHQRSFYLCHRKDRYLTKYMNDFINLMTSVEKPFLH